MTNPISKIDNILTDCITALRSRPFDCFVNPCADFTREHGPFTFYKTVMVCITQGKQNMDSDSAERFMQSQGSSQYGTPSALIQAKQKIKPECFKDLNDMVVQRLDPLLPHNGFMGRRLLAVDGSKINMNTDLSNPDYLYPSHKEGGKPYSQFHFNACIDLDSGMIITFNVQPGRASAEREALKELTAQFAGDDSVVIVADRGYERYSLVCWLNQNRIPFVIRGRDIHSNGIASSIPDLPESEFDIQWNITLTQRHTKETRGHPEKYKILTPAQCMDIPELYQLNLRVVRIQISEGSYEVLLTNLDAEEFSPESLKEIYRRRWGIEVNYMKLKYRIGLNYFQSKKPNLILIETASRVLFYNICIAISCMLVPSVNGKNPDGYKLNFSSIATWMRSWYRHGKILADELAARLSKCVISIRNGRKFRRNLRAQTFRWFAYR